MAAILVTLLVVFAAYSETEQVSKPSVQCETLIDESVVRCTNGDGETVNAWFTGRPVPSGSRVSIEHDSTGIEVIYYPEQ